MSVAPTVAIGHDGGMRTDVDLLRTAADHAIAYAAGVDARPPTPSAADIAALAAFDEPLPDGPTDPAAAIDLLERIGGPATMGTTGANYFGFVNGATYPVALGASFLVNAWDQNAALPVMSPVAAAIYDVAQRWVLDVLRLPAETEVAFVTGATVANASCLAAARDALLAGGGWDVQRDGLFGAPPIHVIIGEKAHSTLRKSLGLIGLGRERVTIVPSDDQGRLRADLLPHDLASDVPVLVCAQAGEVNTGAFDPFDAIADWLVGRNGWLHIDGAFGLWALADPTRTHLVEGLDRADSWATDAHKWLNVTYDCGIALVRRPGALRRTFAAVAGYLPPDVGFEAMHHTPQSSQRARQIEVWSVLRTLGRSGVARMVQQASGAAVLIADDLRNNGFDVLNDVVLNQVLIRLDDAATTERLIAEIQRDGRIWCGATQWAGGTAMRISVSSWKTTDDDARHAAGVIVECARRIER
jgi:glutamate/tyrosine decarboxylase-like PLP-dependent enzyme